MQGEDSELKFTNSSHIDPLKRQCSLVTLQSDPRGHFGKFIQHLRQVTGNYINVLLQISQLSDPKDALAMVKFASNVEGMVIFLPKPIFKEKSDQEAAQAKAKGNDFYKKGDLLNAFRQYTLAVMRAKYPKEDNTEMLAYALGNRSACLFRMDMFEYAIEDINFALSLNYPKATRVKLYERLGRSYLALGQNQKATAAFDLCKNDQTQEMADDVLNVTPKQR